MRKGILLIGALLVATGAFAQQQLRAPMPSPKASLTQTVGITDITITYSRPGVKGRTIWGGLVPYDQVWRTGANNATTISFSDDVLVEGQKLAKGTYSLHTIPGAAEWTVILNSVADQWGSYSYDAAKDSLRVKVKPEKAGFREWMSFEINEMSTDKAKVSLRWENLAVPFTVDTESTMKTMAQMRNAMKPDWRTPYMAANFAFDTRGAATDEEMNAWIDQSIEAGRNIANLYLKARMMDRAGKKADAVRYGEMAIAAASPDQKDFAGLIRAEVDGWKK